VYNKELPENFRKLIIENNRLKEELKRLKTQLGIVVDRSQISEDFTPGEALTGHKVVSGYLPTSEPE